jgi:hypothetical protein
MRRRTSNFETSREKLIQIVLSGQPQLAEKIASPGLVQLRQRISMFGRLDPFSPEATELYIQHRLRAAGYELEKPLFTAEALALIFKYSEGIPRNINNLCFNSLSLGCALKRKAIDGEVVREVVSDLDLDRWQTKTSLALNQQSIVREEAPAFLLPSSEPALSERGVPRLVWALAALFLIGGAAIAGRWVLPRGSVQMTPRAAQLPAAAGPLSHQSPVPARPTETTSQAHDTAPSSAAAPGLASDQNASPIPPTQDVPRTDGAASQIEPVVPQSTSASQSPQISVAETTISVAPGRTLLGICVQNFGSCNPQILQEIRRLNPGLSNLDHIEPGQKIRLPVAEAAVEKAGKAPTRDSNTP